VTGAITVTFDAAGGNMTESTSNVSISNFNIPVGSSAGFDYLSATDALIVGGSNFGVHGLRVSSNDYVIYISDASTNLVG
jgi:hypothetical protein